MWMCFISFNTFHSHDVIVHSRRKGSVSRKWGVRLTLICHEGCASDCAVLLHERVACRLYRSNMTSLKMTSKVRTVSSSDSVNSRCLQVGWGCHGNMCCFPCWKDDFISTFLVDAEINTWPPPHFITEKHSSHRVMNNVFSPTPFLSKRIKHWFLHPFKPYIYN